MWTSSLNPVQLCIYDSVQHLFPQLTTIFSPKLTTPGTSAASTPVLISLSLDLPPAQPSHVLIISRIPHLLSEPPTSSFAFQTTELLDKFHSFRIGTPFSIYFPSKATICARARTYLYIRKHAATEANRRRGSDPSLYLGARLRIHFSRHKLPSPPHPAESLLFFNPKIALYTHHWRDPCMIPLFLKDH